MRNISSLAALQKITATGPLADLDIGALQRFVSFTLIGKNDAGTNPTLAVKVQHADPAVAGLAFTTVGASDNKLKAGASTTVNLGASFTQSGARSVSSALVMLNKIGTITAGKLVTVAIQSDTAGSPSGTVLGSGTIDIDSLVGTAYDWVLVNFTSPIDLADATVYHVVLSADYTASASNCVQWRNATVASGGNFETYDGTNWAAVTTTKSFEVQLFQRTYTDVSGLAFTGLTTPAVFETKTVPAGAGLKKHARGYATIGGTASPAFYAALLVNAENSYS